MNRPHRWAGRRLQLALVHQPARAGLGDQLLVEPGPHLPLTHPCRGRIGQRQGQRLLVELRQRLVDVAGGGQVGGGDLGCGLSDRFDWLDW